MRKAFLIAIATCCIGTSKVYGQIGEPRNDLAIGFQCGIHAEPSHVQPYHPTKIQRGADFRFYGQIYLREVFQKLVLYPTGSQLYQFGMGGIDRNVRRHLQTGYTNPVVSPHGLGLRTKGAFVFVGWSASRLYLGDKAQRWAFQRLDPEPPSGTSKPTIRHAGKEQI